MLDGTLMKQPELDHNVYILGAGFSRDGGLPLVNDFLERMGDCLESDSLNAKGREAIQKVFQFRLKAAAAAAELHFVEEALVCQPPFTCNEIRGLKQTIA